MSEIKYGLISKLDAEVVESVLNYIMSDFPDKHINIVELGCYGGDTGKGICEYVFSKHRIPVITGVDNNKDGETLRFKYDKFIVGNSNEVYNQIEDESQHVVFQDANHTFPMTISDFFCYERKVKTGGYYIIHDCGAHIAPKTGYQCMGSEDDEDMYIACRKAIKRIGLLNNKLDGWKLIFDEADTTDLMGGVVVLKKVNIWD